MKPILFNTEMVKAILDGRKSVTRRMVKPQPYSVIQRPDSKCWCGHFVSADGKVLVDKPSCRPGDTLYVRETWAMMSDWADIDPELGESDEYIYRADWEDGVEHPRWRPSIHMPKKAARLFLRVTDVRVERLQDITEEQARKEGVFIANENSKDICSESDYPDSTARDAFKYLWNSTVKISDIPFYSWIANPWVWAIEFERISKEEAFENA